MKKLLIGLLLSGAIIGVFAKENTFSPVIKWTGSKGAAVKAPQVITTKNGYKNLNAIKFLAVTKGKYQGATGVFRTSVDLSKYEAIEFFIKQHFYYGRKAQCVIRFDFDRSSGKTPMIYRAFTCGAGKWTKVSILFDKNTWKSTENLQAQFNKALRIHIYPFGALNDKGKYLSIAGIRFIPKNTVKVVKKIRVMDYYHVNKPTSGDDKSQILTDGDTRHNAFYRMYSDDPSIIFDLGGIFSIKNIKVNAFSAPSHNFSEMKIMISNDKKNYSPIGVIRNKSMGSKKQLLEFSLKTKKIVAGRYIKVIATRLRPDFPVSLSEFSFYGYVPTAQELTQAMQNTYYIGPVMAAINSKNYLTFNSSNLTINICRQNGIINQIKKNGKIIIERLNNSYTLQSRKKDYHISGYKDQVISIKTIKNGVKLMVKNPKLPGLKIEKIYRISDDSLWEKITIINDSMTKKMFLRIGTDVVVNQKFRNNCFYETSGASHNLIRLKGSEVLLENAATNIPTISLENPLEKLTLFHHLHRNNDQFIYFDHVTEEDRLTTFTPNGYHMAMLTIVPTDAKRQSFESRLNFTSGTLLKAYDNYHELPAVKKFYAAIHRPRWLRDVKIVTSQGWDALWNGAKYRYMENACDVYQVGEIVQPADFCLDDTWGELPVSGKARNLFGGITEVEDIKKGILACKTLSPRIKYGIYTWLWSVFTYSKVFKENPEWFVTKLRNGADASWFPGGFNVNYIRFWNKGSQDNVYKLVMDMVKYYDLDIWYLDGGNSGAYAKDWETMRIDSLNGATELYERIRKGIQAIDRDKIIFFNQPCNPLGDFGFLESFSGALTSQWRKGAAWMYKFKIFQYRDSLRYPTYIYWLPGVDGVYHNYLLGTGLMPALWSRRLSIKDTPYISARYETRQLSLADAKVKPNWRYDLKETLETMPLKQDNVGFVFIQEHAKKQNREVTVELEKLGLTNKSKPTYQWQFVFRNGRKYKGIFSEKDLIAGFRNTGWRSEKVVIPKYLGTAPCRKVAKQTFILNKGEAMLWAITQTPAIILSIDGMPSQFFLPSTPGVKTVGTLKSMSVASEFPNLELGLLLPDNQVPKAIKVNGKPVAYRLINTAGATFAVVKFDRKGKYHLQCQLKSAPKLIGKPQISINWKGGDLEVTANTPDAWKGHNLLLSVIGEDVLCYGTSQKANKINKFLVKIGKTVRDGHYNFIVQDATGSKSSNQFMDLNGFAKPSSLRPVLKALPQKQNIRQIKRKTHLDIRRAATSYSVGAGQVKVDPVTGELKVGTLPMYQNYNNGQSAGFEMKLKRYAKIELSIYLKFHNIYGLNPKRHFVRYNNPNCFAGFIFDFANAKGYVSRSAGGIGKQSEKRQSAYPYWGTKRKPDQIFALNDALYETRKDKIIFYLDMYSLAPPKDWNGWTWVSILLENACPDRSFGIKILSTMDKLPTGQKAVSPISLTKKATPKEFVLNKINNNNKFVSTEVWAKQVELGRMTHLNTSAKTVETPTSVKAIYDDKNLYLHYDCQEPNGKILNCKYGDKGRPWFGDSIEFAIQLNNNRKNIIHGVVDAKGNSFVEQSDLLKKPGTTSIKRDKNPITYKIKKSPKNWTMQVIIPLTFLGIKSNPSGVSLGFNLMRNRNYQGVIGNFTLVPGKKYFTGDFYKLKF